MKQVASECQGANTFIASPPAWYCAESVTPARRAILLIWRPRYFGIVARSGEILDTRFSTMRMLIARALRDRSGGQCPCVLGFC